MLITDNSLVGPTHSGLASGTIQTVAPPSRVGLVLAGVSVSASAAVLVGMLMMRGRAVPVSPDFTASPDPIVSANVVDRVTPLPAVPEPDPSTAPVAASVDELPAVAPEDAAGAVKPVQKPPAARPVPQRNWGVRPPTKPHIADKPRY
jgi:hypothetical protein